MESELIEKLFTMDDYEYYQYLLKTYNRISDDIKEEISKCDDIEKRFNLCKCQMLIHYAYFTVLYSISLYTHKETAFVAGNRNAVYSILINTFDIKNDLEIKDIIENADVILRYTVEFGNGPSKLETVHSTLNIIIWMNKFI